MRRGFWLRAQDILHMAEIASAHPALLVQEQSLLQLGGHHVCAMPDGAGSPCGHG